MPEESQAQVETAEEPARERPAPGNTRRGLLLGAGMAVGVAGLAAACGGSDDKSDSSGSASDQSTTGNSGSAGGAEDAVLASTSDIPVGGGKVFKSQKVVVTQPTQGEFKAFSSTCTHRGCSVGSVSGGLIACPCHGSKFKIADGSVADPPATKPLAEKKITVSGDKITLA